MKKKKLKLSKSVIAKLQNDKMGKIIGGGTETITCEVGCVDEQSIVVCEISSPCLSLQTNCNYESNVNCG